MLSAAGEPRENLQILRIKKAQARQAAIAASRQIAANALASLGKPAAQ